ncbi:MAG TPA: NrfD/PsrC family molybdoenzyme membrane anchor subunit [Polyangiaceae bacterium]|jgi:molybdopterin-containing oxidoreductase family membrane subunit|nr:NrfD/PsrC family molybdoenzyme membrane anchor subunit [Polyangiaceae bacterium]
MTSATIEGSAAAWPTPDRSPAADELALLPKSQSDLALTQELLDCVLKPPAWLDRAIVVTGLGSGVLVAAVIYTLITGIGVWGNNIPVAWAFGITNFVWWIGIGHAGTFISAFLLLLEQKWRTSINRFAEAMTLFAVMQAGLFPLLHMGRAWFFYWLVPYPSTMKVWPQFRSSLTWDVAAVSTYFTVSLLFWYLGLIPDLAALRDYAKEPWRRRIYGIFALGWHGSAATWRRHRIAYGVLAGIAAPLVVSVHSIVSMDFAIGLLPGWHSTIFPPYFVAGAIYSGFALVLTLMIPARRLYRLEHVITRDHLEKMGKMLLVTGSIVTYAYAVEIYSAWAGGDAFDRHMLLHVRPHGPIAPIFWTVIVCNCGSPLVLWSRRVRMSARGLFVVSLAIQLGMWLERFLLIVSSESADFLPSSAHYYHPSFTDGALLCGTLSFFTFLFCLFLRFVPFIPLSELKALEFELRGRS